jgi:hypothetical protein
MVSGAGQDIALRPRRRSDSHRTERLVSACAAGDCSEARPPERVPMQFRPSQTVRRLRDHADGPYAILARATSLISLMGHSYLDQIDRPRRRPTRDDARRVIRTKFAKYIRMVTLAHLHDCALQDNKTSIVSRKLLRQIARNGGLAAIANAPSSNDLIARFKAAHKEIRYVVLIVEYLLRSKAFPEHGIPSTIEDAKGFVWLESSEYGITKIGQIWEDYKLAAPYLFALHLEKSFRPSEIKRVDDVVTWAAAFVTRSRRVERFLGRAAFAMDSLKTVARDQRERDFIDIARVQPPLRPFTHEEILVASSIDRLGENYGKSFQPKRPLQNPPLSMGCCTL